MSALLARHEAGVMVDYGHWTLDDENGPQSPMPLEHGSFMSAGHNVVYFFSPVRDQEATLVLEVWDGEPVRPVGAWEHEAEGEARFDGGEVTFNALKDQDDRFAMSLGGPGSYLVRCLKRGTARLIEEYAALPDDGWVVGLEVYHVQVWPV